MIIRIHPHAQDRMPERGVTEEEITSTVENGESFPAKLNRLGFRKNFPYESLWNGKFYHFKQVEVIAVEENNAILVLTVISKYY